jgi:hypothetical protein
MPGRRESLVVICALLLFISASTTALSLNTTVRNVQYGAAASGRPNHAKWRLNVFVLCASFDPIFLQVSNGPKRTILSGGEFYDIDGDGYKDLLLAGSGQKADLSVWFGGSSGTWTTQGLALNLGINTNLAKQKPYELIDASACNRDFIFGCLRTFEMNPMLTFRGVFAHFRS